MKKTSRICARCCPEEETIIKEKASLAGLTVSQYLITCAMNKKIFIKTDHKMIDTLNKLGGLQKHLFYQGSDPVYYEKIMKEIIETIKKITD